MAPKTHSKKPVKKTKRLKKTILPSLEDTTPPSEGSPVPASSLPPISVQQPSPTSQQVSETSPLVTPLSSPQSPQPTTDIPAGSESQQTPPPPPPAPVETATPEPATPPPTPPSPVSSGPTESPVDEEFEPEESPGNTWKTIMVVFVTALLVGALAVVGIFYFQSSSEKQLPSAEPTGAAPTSSPTGEETATEGATLTQKPDLTTYSLQVLNGAGVPGAASTVQDLLIAAGFEDIAVGNAGAYDYEDTEVQMKEDVSEEVYTAITEALKDYSVVKSDEPLEETADYDIVIIVGQKT